MDYNGSIMKSILYVEKNLSNEITLEDVAREALFSPFHFHKVFFACTGKNLGEYIKKRRLTDAAIKLVDTAIPIIHIAMDCGYESQEAFTRAFKRQFGVTPAKYRLRKKHLSLNYTFPIGEREINYFQSTNISLVFQGKEVIPAPLNSKEAVNF